MTEGPFAIVAAVAAVIAAIGAIYEFAIGPRWRRHRLKKPCRAWFVISAVNQRLLPYAAQTDSEHYVEQLTLAPHSEFEIEILYKATISFVASEIYFGCNEQDNRNLETKPLVKSFFSLFVERGVSEESPETHPDNFTDRHKYYHVRRLRNTVRNETYSIGCKLQTREVGVYTFNLCFLSEEVGRARGNLSIRVEENPSTRMRCVLPKHRWAGCFVQPLAPLVLRS
jgi:hypothetical protein